MTYRYYCTHFFTDKFIETCLTGLTNLPKATLLGKDRGKTGTKAVWIQSPSSIDKPFHISYFLN